MRAYRVTVLCDAMQMTVDGVEDTYGFIKNQYVWANSEPSAISKAKHQASKSLQRQKLIQWANDIVLKIDEVECDIAFWKPLFSEGFIFYKQDKK
jgi:hypothetical protein